MASISARSDAVLAALRSDSQSWATGLDGRSIRLKMLSMFNMADSPMTVLVMTSTSLSHDQAANSPTVPMKSWMNDCRGEKQPTQHARQVGVDLQAALGGGADGWWVVVVLPALG